MIWMTSLVWRLWLFQSEFVMMHIWTFPALLRFGKYILNRRVCNLDHQLKSSSSVTDISHYLRIKVYLVFISTFIIPFTFLCIVHLRISRAFISQTPFGWQPVARCWRLYGVPLFVELKDGQQVKFVSVVLPEVVFYIGRVYIENL